MSNLTNRQLSIAETIVGRKIMRDELAKGINYMTNVLSINVNERTPDFFIEKIAKYIKGGCKCLNK